MLRSVDIHQNTELNNRITSKLLLEFSERKLLLCSIDILTIAISFGISIWLQVDRASTGSILQTFANQSLWMAVVGAGWLLWLYLNDLYELRMAVKVRRSLNRIAIGAMFMSAVFAVYCIATPIAGNTGIIPIVSPLTPLLAIAIATGLLSLWRTVYRACFGAVHSRERIVIYGAGSSGIDLARTLERHPHYEIVGFIDDDSALIGQSIDGIPILGNRHIFAEDRSGLEGIGQIILAVEKPIDDELLDIFTACYQQGTIVTPMPIMYEKVTGKVAIDRIGSQWYAALPMRRSSFDTLNRLSKRTLDLVCGTIIGLVLLVVFPFVALAIRLESKGAIFYRQERVGLHGKKFMVYKFRSMVTDAEVDGKARWAVKGDSRITRVGGFLRKTRLDELPQVINLLCGEMSMVGPRPERQQFIDKLQLEIPFYTLRLAAKPGLTGWAQVRYGYGATVEDAAIKLQYDLYYLKHQSLLLDLKIILRTFGVVIEMRGQ